MTDLTSLIEKLEKAEGPDRELDCQIAVSVDGFYELPPKWEGGPVGYGYTDAEGTEIHPGHGGDQLVRSYSSSIDSALKLTARVLPGWCFEEIGEDFEGHPTGLVGFGWSVEISNGVARSQGQAKTLPIAICLAALRALQQKGSSNA